MRIKNIDRNQFDQLLPAHRVLEHLIGKEVEWFANRAKTCLGTIALNAEGSWVYSVLRLNRLGNFNVIDVGWNIFNYYQTRVQLLSAMC